MKRPERDRRQIPGVLYGATGRTRTVGRLIVRLTAERGGIAPTDAELATLLACSESRIRKHRGLLRL